MNESYALLVQAARLTFTDLECRQLTRQLVDFQEWEALVSLAEAHSLAPLLYRNLQYCGLTVPPPVRLALQGLWLRHRQANETRLRVLADTLAILQEVQIPVLVLKGAALAHIVYPEPGLRPMSDLDLLVPPEHAQTAQRLLVAAGFFLHEEAVPVTVDHHHLPVLAIERENIIVSVEIHRRLTAGFEKPFAVLWERALPFNGLSEQTAFTLRPEDMLWHLYNHTLAEHTRLIRLVDFTAVAEHYMAVIDWPTLRRVQPEILAALSNLHFVIPLSPKLIARAAIPVHKKPGGAEWALYDWPPLPRRQWPGKSRREILTATFFPSEFSIRLYYGVANDRSAWQQRFVRHPWQVWQWWWQRRREV